MTSFGLLMMNNGEPITGRRRRERRAGRAKADLQGDGGVGQSRAAPQQPV
jgi:hypothetical protein